MHQAIFPSFSQTENLLKYERKGENDTELIISVEKYSIPLRSSFGTSHSSTTVRNNALLHIQVDGVQGYGEIGLPPRKPGVYEADFDDVITFVKAWCYKVSLHAEPFLFRGVIPVRLASPFAGVPLPKESNDQAISPVTPLRALRAPELAECDLANEKWADLAIPTDRQQALFRPRVTLALMFKALDECTHTGAPYAKAAAAGLEGALLDAWATLHRTPVYRLLDLPARAVPWFYTVAIDKPEVCIDNAKFGLRHTPNLKFKVDDDPARAAEVFRLVQALYPDGRVPPGVQWVIDANGAWSPDTALAFLRMLRPYQGIVTIIEQPWDPLFGRRHIPPSVSAQWQAVKARFEEVGIRFMADESCTGPEVVTALKDHCSLVNLKLEKQGGFRAALKTAAVAMESGMQIWIGMMVGSSLLANEAAQLIPLCVGCDLDGSLLVEASAEICDGGLEFGRHVNYGLASLGDAPGLGVRMRTDRLPLHAAP